MSALRMANEVVKKVDSMLVNAGHEELPLQLYEDRLKQKFSLVNKWLLDNIVLYFSRASILYFFVQ